MVNPGRLLSPAVTPEGIWWVFLAGEESAIGLSDSIDNLGNCQWEKADWIASDIFEDPERMDPQWAWNPLIRTRFTNQVIYSGPKRMCLLGLDEFNLIQKGVIPKPKIFSYQENFKAFPPWSYIEGDHLFLTHPNTGILYTFDFQLKKAQVLGAIPEQMNTAVGGPIWSKGRFILPTVKQLFQKRF